MNVNSGGKQPLMRPGYYLKDNIRFKQHMVFTGGPKAGQAKGLKVVCEERFGTEAIQGMFMPPMGLSKSLKKNNTRNTLGLSCAKLSSALSKVFRLERL